MDQKSQYRSLTMTVLMSPEMANFSGHIHGGAMLRLLDQVAYACASQYSGCYVVTISVDQVFFLRPIYVGELAMLMASVNYTGRSSMEIGVRVEARNIQARTDRHVMTCYFSMVAVDANRNSVAVPALELTTPTERRRFAEAKMRRDLRREIEARNLEIKREIERSQTDINPSIANVRPASANAVLSQGDANGPAPQAADLAQLEADQAANNNA